MHNLCDTNIQTLSFRVRFPQLRPVVWRTNSHKAVAAVVITGWHIDLSMLRWGPFRAGDGSTMCRRLFVLFGALLCIVHYYGSKEQQALSDGTAEEENGIGLRPHPPIIWNGHVSVGIAPWPWYPCCFLDSVLLCFSRSAQRHWNERRCRWVGRVSTTLAQTDDMLLSSLTQNTPSSLDGSLLPPHSTFYCPLGMCIVVWKKSAGCLFESGHYQFFNLQQVRKIPWPKPERVVAGKVRNTTWRKAPGRGGENINTEARTPSSICVHTFPGLKITSSNWNNKEIPGISLSRVRRQLPDHSGCHARS